MAILATGNSFTTADQVTAATLNAATNAATFASGAVDNSTTQIDGSGQSIVTNVNQTGASTGTAMVFNTAGAPTVTLTAGKWLVVGTVASRMSDVAGAAGFRFSDSAAANFFGAGCAPALSTTRGQVTVQGYKDVTSGTFDVFFHAIPVAGSTINLGEATGISYAGTITAIKLEDTG